MDKVYDVRRYGNNDGRVVRRWWMQLALMPECKIVAATRRVVMLRYQYIARTSRVTVAHFVAVLEQLERLHKGRLLDEEWARLQEWLDLAETRSDMWWFEQGHRTRTEVTENLGKETLKWTHGDIRLSNIVFADAAATSRLIDFDFTGRDGTDRYPGNYAATIDDGARHKDATGKNLLQISHDLYAMGAVMRLFRARPQEDPSDDWCNAYHALLQPTHPDGCLAKVIKRLRAVRDLALIRHGSVCEQATSMLATSDRSTIPAPAEE